jgi:photosynthetic reaction center H subunit
MDNEEIKMEEESTRLFRLDDLDDFEVSDDDPDIRGWDVIGEGGEKVGRVDELIVEPDMLQVRYMDIEMEEELNNNGERHLLVPIGIARLDESDDRVLITDISKQTLRSCPIYTGQTITRSYEQQIRNALHIEQEVVNPEEAEIVNAGDTMDEVEVKNVEKHDFYAHPHFSDLKFYGPRRQKKTSLVENPKPIRKKQDFTLPPKL